MNSNTGHLIDANDPRWAELLKDAKSGYEPVPPHLEPEARKRLAGDSEAWVPKHGRSPLAKHAAERRKAKRQAEKQARKRNRP